MGLESLTSGIRASLVKRHNAGQSIEQAAAATGISSRLIEEFLSSRPGYPNKITTGRPTLRSEGLIPRDERPKTDAMGRVKVSLPRVRLLSSPLFENSTPAGAVGGSSP